MKKKVDVAVTLTDKQLTYLERMTEAHGLPDVSKTLRVLVAYAMATPDEEPAIFEVVRCANPDVCEDGQKAGG